MRLVRLGSEPVTSDDFTLFVRHFKPECTLLHTLSSSETGNVTQFHLRATDRVATGRLCVGRAVAGIELHVVDAAGRNVAPGQYGQIVVRSRYLSPGYWGNPKLTASCFGTSPAHGEVRTFRSGDMGRFTAEGLLFVEGRSDSRVKIHGYRIELSEVEAAILRQPGVTHAVVAAGAQPNDDPKLVAYLSTAARSEFRWATPAARALIDTSRIHGPQSVRPAGRFSSHSTRENRPREARANGSRFRGPSARGVAHDGNRATRGTDLVRCSWT